MLTVEQPKYGSISVAAILSESARRFPDTVAIIADDEKTTYSELWEQTKRYAGTLRSKDIEPGDRVAVLIPNVTDFARVYYAVLALGAVVVPIHALLKAREIDHVLRDSGASLLICASSLIEQGRIGAARAGVKVLTVDGDCGDDTLERLEQLALTANPIDTYEPCTPDQAATILYTSGTTGTPKGAVGTHFALVEQVNVLLTSTFDVRPGDVLFGGLPLFHTFGQTCVLNVGLRAGTTIVLLSKFSGVRALELLEKHKINIFFGVPTMYSGLLGALDETPSRPTDLRYCISGGASLPVALLDRFIKQFDAKIYEGYGLTETSPVACFNHVGDQPIPGSIGKAIWGVDVAIAHPEVLDRIEFVPNGEIGEIVIRGHNLFKGYLNRPEATAEAITDGWFRSGDLGDKDENGVIRVLDRKKDMIDRNGYNVYPREVEEILTQHPGVASAAVFGVPDELHGQEVWAAVVPTPNSPVSEAELFEYAKTQLAAYKYPRTIKILDALPVGPTGKILKRKLTEQYQAQ